MVRIVGENIYVEYPIYGIAARSLKASVFNSLVGGMFTTGTDRFPVIRSLNNLSFEFKEGDRVGVIGPNGSGKSTFLRLLSGSFMPVRGTLTVVGSVNSMLSISAGMDLQSTGLENIKLRARILNVQRKHLSSFIEDVIDFSGIGGFHELPMSTYSSGMQMRLAFSLATTKAADIVILDEWISVGDSDFSVKVNNRLSELVSRASILILASHNTELVKQQCNRLLKLEHGQFVEDGGISIRSV